MARVVTTDPDGSTSTVSYEYDAGGTRTRQTVDDGTTVTTTEYLTDHRNATGYSQTLVETTTVGGIETRRVSYVIGHDQISQTVAEAGATATRTFHADGKGTTTVLTDAAAALLQLYLYDAYGNLLNMEAEAALTGYLYNGEYFDASIGQQYLRARWYDATTGRFNRLDPFFGNHSDPQSFHKYLYTHAGPVNGIDPTGEALSAIHSLAGVSFQTARRIANYTAVTGAAVGGTNALFDAALANDATLLSVLESTFWGATNGLVGGYVAGLAGPYLAALGPAATGLVGGSLLTYGAYNSYQATRDAWASGNHSQAIYRGTVGFIESAMALIGVVKISRTRLGKSNPTSYGRRNAGVTGLPGNLTMNIIRQLAKTIGVKAIRVTSGSKNGLNASRGQIGRFRAGKDKSVIEISKDAPLSALVHELMHAAHYFNLQRTLKGMSPTGILTHWRDLPKTGQNGKEQAAYQLTEYFWGRWMTPEELAAHKHYVSQRGGDPSNTLGPYAP